MHKVGITGHQNLPKKAINFAAQEIANRLYRLNGAFVGISSLAAGADQLFAETVLQAKGQLHAVIPCNHYEATFTDDNALQSFHRLLENAAFVETLEYDHPSEDAFLAAGHRVVALSDVLIAVWDGLEAKGKGGTADVVRYAQENQKELFIVWPQGVRR
jgi:predicted Rossmann fold nucleotide-binding protein DprA/Smf involved in DNA uptake